MSKRVGVTSLELCKVGMFLGGGGLLQQAWRRSAEALVQVACWECVWLVGGLDHVVVAAGTVARAAAARWEGEMEQETIWTTNGEGGRKDPSRGRAISRALFASRIRVNGGRSGQP